MIYLLEDDDSIRKLIDYSLKSQGFDCKSFSLPSDFWKNLEQEDQQPELILLDLMLPQEDGISILKKQVDDIVGYFDILSKYDDSENPYDAYPSTEAEKLRDDTVVQGLEISDVKKVSKDFMDGYFQVPKVLGEGA